MSASMEERLRAYYRSTDAPIDDGEKARVVALVFEEAARCSAGVQLETVSFGRFLVGQLRFINPVAWAVQIALLVGMLFLVHAYRESGSAMLVVMIAAILSVAIAVPSVFKSFESSVTELEASCRYDATQVLASRLVLFGLADVLWMSLAIWLVPTVAGGDPFRVFLYAATPFFAFCAICFYLSRITQGRCVKACIVAASCVIVAIWGVSATFPYWYSNASMAVWSVALVAALALAGYEARRLVSHVAADSVSRMALATRI